MGQQQARTPPSEIEIDLKPPIQETAETASAEEIPHGESGNDNQEVKDEGVESTPPDKNLDDAVGAACVKDQSEVDVGCPGPNRVRKLFRRHSSMKVSPESCPDGFESPESAGASPSSPPMDTIKNSFLLFSGTMCPVALGDSTDVEEGFISPMQLYNSMNDGQLSPYMFDPLFMLIIDTRSMDDYQLQHISTAVHVSELSMSTNKIEPLESYTLIVLYDHKGLSHSLLESALSKTVLAIQSQGIEPFSLAGGFDNFHIRHPYLCSEQVPTTHLERQMLICDYPSIVVEDQLYLGRADQAANPIIKGNLRLTHVVNVTRDHPNAFEGELRYCNVEVDDESTAELLHEFPTVIQFINSALNQGGCILVHCNLGRSRSSTVVIAYLMFSRKWTLRDAYYFLKERRPIIHPNRGFISQLSKFEEFLFGRKLTKTNNIHNL